MWHEARKQERRIRGLIVDYRRRAERRQDFYEKIQADPTQFIQIHGRRCKIYLDPAVAAAGDGSAIIVPWQGQRDNLIDRFDVRAHLDCIPAVTKPSDTEPELSQEERQCNYERYRILAQNDFLNLTEEKFLHQLFLEEQFGANAPLDACQSSQAKKKFQKSGAAIGYSYDDTGNSSISNVIDASQPYSHLKQTGAGATSSKRNENESDSESESDIDMDVSIEVSKLDTSQAHELNACGRNYGMLSNDFYSYLTKDADEADAMRIAREEEREKMLLSGRKSRRERKAQKERRLARHTFSPPSYAAKEDNTGKDDESESRSPSPSDTTEKITYITSFGGEDELQPHSKITITLGRGSSTLGAACVDASTSSSHTSYAQKVKDNLDKFQKSSQHTVRNAHSRSRSKTRSHSRTRTRRSSYRQARRTRSRSQSYHWRRKSNRRSRSRSLSSGRRHYPRQYKSPYKRSRSRSRSKSRSRRRRYTSSPSSRSSRSLSPRRSSRRNRYSPKRSKPSKQCSRSSSVANSFRESIVKEESPKKIQQKVEMLTRSSKEVLKLSPAPIPPSVHPDDEEIKNAAPSIPDVEPPPPLKRYYGRKRGEYSSSSESGSETDDLKLSRLTEATEAQEQREMDTTSETSNPLPSTSAPYKCKPQTGKYGSTTFVSNAPETKMTSSSGSGTGVNVRLNLRERLKKKMQNLLNKQYKADKKAEIEKSERERQQQQERYEEMRELAIKLRRRQREIRHRYGTPNSKASESETSDYAATACRERRSKSHSSDRSSCKKSSTTQRLKSPFSPTKRSRSREGRRSPSRPSRHKATVSRSESRSRRSSSRRRRRSISRSKRHREPSQEHALSRYVSERSRYSERYRRSRSKSIRDKEKEKHKQDRFRSDRAEDDGRLRSDRHRERERERDHRHRGGRVEQQSSLTSATSSSTSASRSRVVISAPPKLKKLVDY